MQGLNVEQFTQSQAKLFAKLVKIVKEAKSVTKSGYNKAQNYQYSTEADILDVVRDALCDAGIFIATSSNVKEVVKIHKYKQDGTIIGDQLVTVVETQHVFCDSETGATLTTQGCGTGWDSTDKGAFKGVTGAMKYFFGKNFLIESEDDPENDGANKSYIKSSGSPRQSFSGKTKTATKAVEKKEVKKEEKTEAKKEVETAAATPKKSFGKKSFVKPAATQEPEF